MKEPSRLDTNNQTYSRKRKPTRPDRPPHWFFFFLSYPKFNPRKMSTSTCNCTDQLVCRRGFLLRRKSFPLADLIFALRCKFHCSFLSRVIPRYLTASEYSISSCPIFMGGGMSYFHFLVKRTATVFAVLNFSPLFVPHCSALLMARLPW